MNGAGASQFAQTVVALFDDQLDAESALGALRKAARPASSVSVLARDRSALAERMDEPIDVTTAMMDTSLPATSGWLLGLASMMVPEHGTFLAAGPIGMALARIRHESPGDGATGPANSAGPGTMSSVGRALEQFGFQSGEALYLERRLAAGSAMIAVTAGDEDQIAETLRLFADHSAVFIGQAETPVELLAESAHWLANPLNGRSAEVIVADIVVTLRHACHEPFELEIARLRCGTEIIDQAGEHVGEVDDMLFDPGDDSIVRYVIGGHGGVLGIARRRVAIPGSIVRFEETSVRIGIDRSLLQDAPSFDENVPFSRKHELETHEYFGVKPYWVVE